MSDNFINWLLGIGPTKFSIEQQMPHPPEEKKQDDAKKQDETKPIDPDASTLGYPRG